MFDNVTGCPKSDGNRFNGLIIVLLIQIINNVLNRPQLLLFVFSQAVYIPTA